MSQTIPFQQRKEQLGKLVFELWAAGLPLVVSLTAVLFSLEGAVVANLLITVLFVCSLLLAIRRLPGELRAGRFAGPAIAAGFIFWYTYPAMLSVLPFGPTAGRPISAEISDQTAILALVSLSLFLFSWQLASRGSANHRSGITSRFSSTAVSPRFVALCALIVVLVSLLPYVLSGQSLGAIVRDILSARDLSKPWLYLENLGNDSSPFFAAARNLGVASGILLWMLALDRRLIWGKRTIALALAVLITAVVYFENGTRSLTALLLLPPLGKVLYDASQRHSSPRVFFLGLLMVGLVILILQFQLLYRAERTRLQLTQLLFSDLAVLGGTTDYFKETLFAVEIVPQYHDFFRESVVFQFLSYPIPRFIWPDKPVSALVQFYSLLRIGIDIYARPGNVFPGIVGQYYMSWGWIGPIMIGAALGWVGRKTDDILGGIWQKSRSYAITFALLIATWLFLSYRVLSPGFLPPVLLVGLILVFASRSAGKLSA